MVNLDLGIAELIGLKEIGKIKKDKLKEHLNEFSKEDIIDYLVIENEDSEDVGDYP